MSAEETLEERLKSKLSSGEIDQEEYNELYNKFKELGLLHSDRTSSFQDKGISHSGSTRLDGGKINGNVNIHGRVAVDNSLECRGLNISGSANIDGDLTVLGKTSISGEVVVHGKAKFVDKIALSGSLSIDEDMLCLQTTSLAGKTRVGGNYQVDGKSLISGKFNSTTIKSTGQIIVEGKITTEEDIIAEHFECQSGIISIGGSLRASKISIFSRFRDVNQSRQMPDQDLDDSIMGLVSNVVNVVFPTLLESVSGIFDTKPTKLTIRGDLEGEEVDISYCTINGDVTGTHVIIGPNVVINGKIKYRDSIDVPSSTNYTIEEIQ